MTVLQRAKQILAADCAPTEFTPDALWGGLTVAERRAYIQRAAESRPHVPFSSRDPYEDDPVFRRAASEYELPEHCR